jgi:hypothetical protein
MLRVTPTLRFSIRGLAACSLRLEHQSTLRRSLPQIEFDKRFRNAEKHAVYVNLHVNLPST